MILNRETSPQQSISHPALLQRHSLPHAFKTIQCDRIMWLEKQSMWPPAIVLFINCSCCNALLLLLGAQRRHGTEQIRILIRIRAGVRWSKDITGFQSYYLRKRVRARGWQGGWLEVTVVCELLASEPVASMLQL